MISRAFDIKEYIKPFKKYGKNAKDDDERLFPGTEATTGAASEGFRSLEVAHIIPHSFVSLSQDKKELVCIIMCILDF